MQNALRKLLNEVEAIGDDHEELFDTDVREAMGEALFLAILRRDEGYVLPNEYGMFSDEGNRRVAAALGSFVVAGMVECEASKLSTFHQRLQAFQDSAVVTEGGNDFEEFFGWTDPDVYDEAGALKPQ